MSAETQPESRMRSLLLSLILFAAPSAIGAAPMFAGVPSTLYPAPVAWGGVS